MDLSERPVWRTRAWAVAAATLAAAMLVLSFLGVSGNPVAVWLPVSVTAAIVSAVLCATLLRVRRERRAHEERLTSWAAERAAQAERLRIARELHDLASHGLGLITVRAAAAGRVNGEGAEHERLAALRDIERSGRQATTELRRMLAVLRSGEDAPAPLRPAETLDDLPGIVDAARAAGLSATLSVCPESESVSAGVQLVICSVVREALANVARHAGPTTASVDLSRSGEEVTVRVEDRGPVPGWEPHPGTGLGISGLRERVAAVGGSLEAGRAEGGYCLVAILPDGESAERRRLASDGSAA